VFQKSFFAGKEVEGQWCHGYALTAGCERLSVCFLQRKHGYAVAYGRNRVSVAPNLNETIPRPWLHAYSAVITDCSEPFYKISTLIDEVVIVGGSRSASLDWGGVFEFRLRTQLPQRGFLFQARATP
jgi:hypothetical protein